MYTIQDLEVTRVMPRKDGIFAFAKYPDWWTEYNFLVQPDGKVMGKTGRGLWIELSEELSNFVRYKVRFILKNEPNHVYA